MQKTFFFVLLIALVSGSLWAFAAATQDHPAATNSLRKSESLTANPAQPGQFAAFSLADQKFENRCGWFSNPTPANAWLVDRDGEWVIGSQGGYQADGDYPAFKPNQWVETNGSYGYGCACLRVKVNRKTHEVIEIKSSTPRPLAVCRKDRSLKEPK